MSTGELACTYAALILHDDGIPVTADKIETIVKAANVPVESYWPPLFAKLCENRDINDLITNVGSVGGAAVAATTITSEGGDSGPAAAPAAEEKKEEEKEDESDEDLGLSLFD